MTIKLKAALAPTTFLVSAASVAPAQDVSGEMTFYIHFGQFAKDGT